MGLWIALGIVALIFVGEGLTIVAFLFAADAENHNPATVDLQDAPVYAIDSAGRAYEAVPVEPCGRCGQTLPADHRTRGLCTPATVDMEDA